jgi:hypothetical protein
MTTEETAPQGSESTEQAPPSEATDFREYVKWRKSGDPPAEAAAEKPEPPASDTPPATEPAPDTGTDQPPQEPEEEEEHEQPGKGGSRQRKITKLIRENEQLRERLAAASQPRPAEPPKQEQTGKPKLENFETLEAYQEALSDWIFDQRDAKRKAEADQAEQQKAIEKLQTEWDSRQQAARKLHQDYDDAIEAIPAPEGPGVFAARQAMLEDEAGAEILYWLAKHPDEIKRSACNRAFIGHSFAFIRTCQRQTHYSRAQASARLYPAGERSLRLAR